MGQRHNRKQVRHRPVRRRLHYQQQPSVAESDYVPSCALMPQLPLPSTSTLPGNRYMAFKQQLSNPIPPTNNVSRINAVPAYMKHGQPAWKDHRHCECTARDRRFFGGEEGEGPESEADALLKGRMLDVVLGLFDGIDYVD